MVEPKQFNELEILNPDDRMFRAWGTVDIRDHEGDYIPISEIKKIMPTIMKRGGLITDRHSNRQVGKIINYEFKMKETSEGPKEGVLITGQVFKDYPLDNMIWEGIKKNIYKGMSFGGRNHNKELSYEKGKGLTNILTDLEGYEFALVPGMGNEEATMEEVNFLAKSGMAGLGEEIQKPFAGFKDWEACVREQLSQEGVSQESADRICGSLKAKYENVEKAMTVGGFESPEPGDLPEAGAKLLADVYAKYRKEGMGKEEAAKRAWGAVHNAGYSSNSSEKMDTAKKGDILEKDKMENQETPQAMPSVEERLSKLEEMISQLVQANSVEKQEGKKPCEAGAESKPEEVTKEQGKPEENVVLPKTPEEEIQENKPAEGAKVDEVKVVEKEGANLADETVQDIKDIKKMLKTASTPRPASDTGLINKSVQYKMPTNWKEANALARKLAK